MPPSSVADLAMVSQGPDTPTCCLPQRDGSPPLLAKPSSRESHEELVLGPYRVLKLIGEGGMGQVFKAVHQRLQRVVALKIIRPGHLTEGPETVRRFQREARAAAMMAHPNVVTVYDADQAGDTYFIALEFVEGIDLAKLVKECGPLPVTQACDYIRQAALGLQHAYEHGMVHRDIKPSNLLVTRSPRKGNHGVSAAVAAPRVAEVVKILDMGLVRMVQEAEGTSSQASLTREGAVMGTPDYISPEQARNAHKVDIRADLYSLGCTFHYLLTGQPPFPEGTVIEKLLMHQLEEPRPVEKIRPEVPPGVVMVVRKLMAKRCEDRYRTPAAVALALAAVLPRDVTTPGISQAPEAKPPAPAPIEATLDPKAEPTPETPPPGTSAAVSAPAETMAGQERPKPLAILKGHSGCVLSGAFTSNRDSLATGGIDGTIRLWDFGAARPRQRAVLGAPSKPGAATLLPVGERTLSSAPAAGSQSLAFSPNNRMLAAGSGGMDGLIRLWDMTKDLPEALAVLPGHRSPVEALAFAPDGNLLVSGGNDRMVRLWDLSVSPPRERTMLRGHRNAIKALAFAPDGQTLASGSQDGTIRLWNTHNRLWSREQAVLSGHEGHVTTVSFAPDGQTLASGSQDQTVRLWELAGGQPVQRIVLQGHPGVVRLVLIPPDGQMVVSVDDRSHVIQWELNSGQKVREWQIPESLLCSAALTFDGRYLAAGSTNGRVSVFRLGTKRSHR